ncbi:hypothetical protein ABL78_5009 [Leptomonas seymouri]|uniref:Uncharacterized protein n=1 Tax=Leptomonas seymouri TaxID=5684 RepID=A0A0N1PBH6_LEPSE|nr:hypothetical protein ABL78_5009 [Leptomonas seymouri]|eukprot:KPI85925.1 hypothetical protein ABL78_5009 [Leptomonas seymouri]
MNQEIRAEYSLQRFTAADALHFIMTNGTKHPKQEGTADASLPGLAKVVELQEKHSYGARKHYCGAYDPLSAVQRAERESHEQLCAHSQTACSLAKNAISAAMRQRTNTRVYRYGQALLQLANASENEELEDGSNTMASDSSGGSLKPANGILADGNTAKDDRATETDEDNEDLENYLLKHKGFATEAVVTWLQHRYLRCCEFMNLRPSVVVSQRLSKCVRFGLGDSVGSFFASQKTSSPLFAAPEQQMPINAKAARSWMTFPETLAELREEHTTPYEVSPDLQGCGDIGKQPRHFVAILGVLEGCQHAVVTFNLSNIGLTNREARVLCLFCHAHLRHLQSLDISDNPGVTDDVALLLKKIAVSLPLLSRLAVHGTSLSQGTIRAIDWLLYRKVL